MKTQHNIPVGSEILTLFLCFCLLAACVRKGQLKRDKEDLDRQIELEQTVTSNVRPKDSIFLNFEKNWVKFISREPVLLRPVNMPQKQEVWNPLVTSDCVFSEGAGAYVPRMYLSWVENDQYGDKEPPVRFDVTLQYQGFERNMYTTIYPMKELERFVMPGNSDYIKDTAAVMLTGAALFPKLVSLGREAVQAPVPTDDIKRQVPQPAMKKYNLVIEDLGGGLSYTIRMCRYNGENWVSVKQYVFSTPVCTQKF